MSDIEEANEIIDFRERRLNWRHWIAVIAANVLLLLIVSALRS